MQYSRFHERGCSRCRVQAAPATVQGKPRHRGGAGAEPGRGSDQGAAATAADTQAVPDPDRVEDARASVDAVVQGAGDQPRGVRSGA